MLSEMASLAELDESPLVEMMRKLNVGPLEEMVRKLDVGPADEMLRRLQAASTLFDDAEENCDNLKKIQEEMEEFLAAWRAKQAEMHSRNLELRQRVALAERNLVSAKMDGSNSEVMERVKEQLANALSRENQMQADINNRGANDFHQDAKETLEKPDPDETFLKNDLSLFLNVSSILPELGHAKFAGTFVDKQRGVKTFKFSSADMSPSEICKAGWDLMR